MRTTWQFHTAGQLVFGGGAVDQLGGLLRRRKLTRALLVADRVLVKAGIVERVQRSLTEAGLAAVLFDGGAPEPSLEVAEHALAAARSAAPDVIVGVGGGSNMDLAKIVAAVQTYGGAAGGYFGFDNIPGPVMPLACVPTTSGTGSEVSHAAVLTDTANEMKVSTLSQYLRPALAVVDPELTWSCPKQVTADSGIDALTHAIEAMTAVDFAALDIPPGAAAAYEGRFPLGECLAEKAIALIGQFLVRAVEKGDDVEARSGMSLAATLAGMAFSNCAVALVHALEYPLGGRLHCSHGAGNGLLLPYVMRFNLPTREATFARIAHLLGEPTAGMSEPDAALAAIAAVERLRRRIGIPERIRDLGGTPDQLPEFAAKSFGIKRLLAVNPRPATEADLLRILEEAF